jgi:4-carboxymuconolactone decarboxylase
MPEDPYVHLRERGNEGWATVTQLPPLPPQTPGSFMDLTQTLLFGDLWHRPHLSVRDRRLITLTVLAGFGNSDVTALHIRGALRSGDLTPEALEEFVVHVAFYAGWPRAAALSFVVGREIAAWRDEKSSPAP